MFGRQGGSSPSQEQSLTKAVWGDSSGLCYLVPRARLGNEGNEGNEGEELAEGWCEHAPLPRRVREYEVEQAAFLARHAERCRDFANAERAEPCVYRLALVPWIRPTLIAGFCS